MKIRTSLSKPTLIAAFLMAACTGASIAGTPDGYVVDSRGAAVKSGTGLCWRTGYWTPAMATSECDADLAKPAMADKKPEIKSAMPAPSPSKAPAQTLPPPKVLSLSADGLFAFGKATLLPESQDKLNALVAQLKSGKYSKIAITGHTDRLGTKKSNLKLSLQRADAVKSFLVSKGIDAAKITTAGKGSASPKTLPGTCKGKKSPKLIACLQPDRRVEISVSP